MPVQMDSGRRHLAGSYGRYCSHRRQGYERDRSDTFVEIRALQTLARYRTKKALYPRFESLDLHLIFTASRYRACATRKGLLCFIAETVRIQSPTRLSL